MTDTERRITYTAAGGELCWFNPDTAARWSDADNDGNGSGGTGRGQAVWRTADGHWVLEHWTRWQGEETRREAMTPDAARDWLLANGDSGWEEYLGPVADEKPPSSGEAADPLEVARMWVDESDRIAAYYAKQDKEDPGLGRDRAHVDGAGRQQFDLIQRASFMAMISAAGDLRRLADAILAGGDAVEGQITEREALAAIIRLIDGPGDIVDRVTGARTLAATALGQPS